MTGLPGEGADIGVIGAAPDAVLAAAAAADLEAHAGEVDAVLDATPGAVVAVGEAALRSLAAARPDIPVLPVEAGPGVRSVPTSRLEGALESLAAGDWEQTAHPLVSVRVDGDHRAWALYDTMLVTAAPAHISEFAITYEGEFVAEFRADGVLAATPAGTPGYARAADSPVIPPGPAVLSVVPIAPFTTTLDDWVVPAEGLVMTVERDEADVELQADGETVCEVGLDDPVALAAEASLEVLSVPESTSPFDRHGAESEKL